MTNTTAGWVIVAFAVGVIAIAFREWREGGKRLALAGALQASLGAGILLSAGPPWLRYLNWAITAALLVTAFATGSREGFRRSRRVLILGAMVVALIWIIELAPMSRGVQNILLVLLGVLTLAFLAVMLAGVFELVRLGPKAEVDPQVRE